MGKRLKKSKTKYSKESVKKKITDRHSNFNSLSTKNFDTPVSKLSEHASENKFWDISVGRKQQFETAKDLWDAACEYFTWCNNNPWIRVDYKGSNAKKVNVPVGRPYTISGFCVFIGMSTHWWRDLKNKFTDNSQRAKEFNSTICAINDIIYTQKFEGAAVGVFNAGMIAFDLGLRKDQPIVAAAGMSVVVSDDESKDLLESVKKKLSDLDKKEK